MALVAFVFAETAYTWNRLLDSSGPSGRALAVKQAPQLSWIDAAVEDGSVAMFAYPFGQEWYPSAVAWWDVEFWNARVDRAYRLDGYITYTPDSFPTPSVRVDPRTGLFVGAGTPDFIVRTPLDARFGPAGTAVAAGPQLELVDLEVPLARAVAHARAAPGRLDAAGPLRGAPDLPACRRRDGHACR